MSTKLKTSVGTLLYVFITGEGRDQAMPGEEPRMQYVASVKFKKGSKEHKALLAEIEKEWEAYKATAGLKPAQKPKTNGTKIILDKDTGEETDEVLVTFKTSTKWKDGKQQVIKVFDHKGTDITTAVQSADWSIGNESTGVIHGTAQGNGIGGAHKVTLYLTAIQLAKLVKYEGTAIEVDELEGDDLDLGDSVSAIDEAPAL